MSIRFPSYFGLPIGKHLQIQSHTDGNIRPQKFDRDYKKKFPDSMKILQKNDPDYDSHLLTAISVISGWAGLRLLAPELDIMRIQTGASAVIGGRIPDAPSLETPLPSWQAERYSYMV